MEEKKKGVSSVPGSGLEEERPPVGEPVWLQFDGFRTMAVRDDRGLWREFATGRELKGDFKILPQT